MKKTHGNVYWNNWYTASIYINDSHLYSLQYVLYNIMQNANYFEQQALLSGNMNAVMNMPRETTKLAMALITIGPVILFYPFLQRYFVEGLTIGSVKG
jgi:putative aldouronate transport system permease protein